MVEVSFTLPAAFTTFRRTGGRTSMARSITPELSGEFLHAVLNACLPARWAGSGALCALIERDDAPQPDDPNAAEAELRVKLERDPTDLETLCALDRLYLNGRGAAGLVATLQTRLDLAVDRDEQWMLLVRLGILHRATGSEQELRNAIDSLNALPRPSGAGASS